MDTDSRSMLGMLQRLCEGCDEVVREVSDGKTGEVEFEGSDRRACHHLSE